MLKNKFLNKIISITAVSAALLGAGMVVNNNHSQTVQASVKNHRIDYATGKMVKHYLNLAKRPGTHYFKHLAVWIPTTNTTVDSYNMSGTDKQESGDTGYSGIVAIGTKTIGSKHFFISPEVNADPFAKWSRKEKYLVPAVDASLPTAYEVKSGHKIPIYIGADKHTSDGFTIEGQDLTPTSGTKKIGYLHPGTRFVVSNPKITQDYVTNNGIKYALVAANRDKDGWIKMSDINANAFKATGRVTRALGTYKNGYLVYNGLGKY